MKIRIVKVPYDTARYETRMGRGPGRILEAGVVARLEALGHAVTVQEVDPRPSFPAEVATAFSVMGGVSAQVREARNVGQFPLVLAGNCNTTVGSIAGLSPRRAGVVWFDGHADLATPQATTSGFIDGMGLAILTGRCWQELAKGIAGFAPLADGRVILAGASDIEPFERALLESSEIAYLSDRVLAENDGTIRLGKTLDRLMGKVEGIHLHIDLDVHDPRIARANHFRPPGGLTPQRLRELIALVVARVPLFSAAITAYDPEVDPEGVTLGSCLALIETIAAESPVQQ